MFLSLYEPPCFRGLCCPRPPFLSIALPWGELLKDLQHDSFLNLLPTVPNQPLIMRHVQQENNLLIPFQTASVTSYPLICQSNVCFWNPFGIFLRLYSFTEPLSLFGSNFVGISSCRSFWELDLSVCQVRLLGTNRPWRLEAFLIYFFFYGSQRCR